MTTGLIREPLEAPVLITENDQTVFLKTIAVSSQNINDIQKSFSSAVWSISPGGEWIATATGIYDFTTGNQLATIPGATSSVSGYTGTKAQAFTSDYNRFVYFDPATRSLNTLNLVDLIGSGPGGQSFTPSPGTVVTPPTKLSWAQRLGISQYHLYLGTNADAVGSATPASPEYLGTISGTQYSFGTPLPMGATYYWRVDPISQAGPQKGPVYSFVVSAISLEQTSLKLRSVTGVGIFEEALKISSAVAGEAWSVSSDCDWISFAEHAGTAPGTVRVRVDSTSLAAGVHIGSIKLSTRTGDLVIPVEFSLEALHLTAIKSDPASSKAYAISENTATPGSKAYLLEIDTAAESILRVVEVGTSATDIAIHPRDNKIYVTNWLGGGLLAVDRNTFEVTRTYAFSPFGGTGYGQDDVFRVSAGGVGRLVVEEEDQWVDISIYNTVTGTKLANAGVREGGGAFDSTGRYYYHGENDSTGAAIRRYDVTGDVFTQLANVRPTDVSYYGSRTVVLSEDDQRVFWGNIAFNAALAPEWNVGETVYSCTKDGRFAFAETKIYDVNRRLQVLGMPASTKVSAFNTTTSKLITPGGTGLQFHTVGLPLQLQSPVFLPPAWSGTVLTLKWTDSSLETAFHLQSRLKDSTTWTDVSTAIGQNAVSFAVSGLADNAAYEFRIRATSPELSSPWSATQVVDLNLCPPPAPNLTSASATSPYSIRLGWSLIGTHSQVILERAAATNPNWEVVATMASGTTSFLDSGLQLSTAYIYRVKTVKGLTASAYSNARTVATPALSPPSPPSFSNAPAASSYQVNLAWTDVTLESSYHIERKLASDTVWKTLIEVSADTVTYADTSVLPNTAYSYRIFATNAVGSSPSSVVWNATTPPIPLPSVPANFAAQAYSATQIALAWSDSSNETGYRIERNIGEDPWKVVAELPANATSYLDSGLGNGTYYNYRIVSFNQASEVVSAEVNVLAALTGALLEDDFDPSLNLPMWSSLNGGQTFAGPQGFYSGKALWFGAAGTRNAVTVPVDVTNGGTLVFQFRAGNQAVDGNTYWNNSEAGEHIVVEFSTGGSTWEVLAILDTVPPNNIKWTPYSITLPVGARSESTQIRWRQLSNSGISQDTWALDNVQVLGVLPPPPIAPAFIIANANAARASAVSWAGSAQATSYDVQRRTPSTDWVTVGTAPSYETYFTDLTVQPATAYSYRVLARNTGGVSDPSQYAFVTTWSSLQEWRFHNYGTISESGASADLQDNGTGVPNLLKYAFNMSKDDRYFVVDELSGNNGLPFIKVEGEKLRVAFIRRRDPQAAGIQYIVEFSSNLKDWQPGGTEILAEPIDEEFEYVVCADSLGLGTSGSRFGRIRVKRLD